MIQGDQQSLDEKRGSQIGKIRGAVAQQHEPVWKGRRQAVPTHLEIIVPPERGGEVLSRPALKTERFQGAGIDAADQHAFLSIVDEIQPGGKVRQRRVPNRSSIMLPVRPQTSGALFPLLVRVRPGSTPWRQPA